MGQVHGSSMAADAAAGEIFCSAGTLAPRLPPGPDWT